MKNYVQKGENITLASPEAVKSGAPVLVGALFGIAAGDAAIGADLDIVTVGVFALPKVATDEFAVGDPVYFDSDDDLVTADDTAGTGKVKIGVAVSIAGNPSGIVNVRLNGFV